MNSPGWRHAEQGGGPVLVASSAGGKVAARAARRVGQLGNARLPAPRVSDAGDWIATLPGKAITPPLDEAGTRALAGELGPLLLALHAAGLTHGGLTWDTLRRDHGELIVVGAGLAAARKQPVDPRDDVRDLGRVLYHAATGAPPFEVPVAELPDGLRATIVRCLHDDPARRWGSVHEVLRALGVEVPLPPPRVRPGRVIAVLVVLLLLAGGAFAAWRFWPRAAQQPVASTPAPGKPAVPQPAPEALAPRPLLVALAPLEPTLDGPQAWLIHAVPELMLDALADTPGIEVSRAAVTEQGGQARKAGVDLLVQPSLKRGDDGEVAIEIRLYDVRGNALRVAERRLVKDEAGALAAVLELVTIVQKSALPAGKPFTPPPGTLPAVPAAWAALAEGRDLLKSGDIKAARDAFSKAAAADPAWLAPALALVDVTSGNEQQAALLAARPLAEKAGGTWTLRYAVAAAEPGAPRIAALRQLLAQVPRDAGLAAELVGELRRSRQAADCVAAADQALAGDPEATAVRRDLIYCLLAEGDGKRALEEARLYARSVGALGDELVGDILFATGQPTAALAAWRTAASAGASAAGVKPPLVEALYKGKCKQATLASRERVSKLDGDVTAGAALARVWAQVALLCGDVWNSKEAEALARGRGADPAAADRIALLTAARRSQKGTFARAQAALASPDLDELGRVEVLSALLIASRSEHQEAAALAAVEPDLAMAPLALGLAPLALEIALTALSAGDIPRAEAACAQLHQALPGWTPASYCDGRVAEAKKDDMATFKAWRSFLDHWVDADEEALWMRDVRRRMSPLLVRLKAPQH